jgi:hypothetical protein
MTEFETKALALLQSINESLMALKRVAHDEEARRANQSVVSSPGPDAMRNLGKGAKYMMDQLGLVDKGKGKSEDSGT